MILPLFILPARRVGVILRDLARRSLSLNAEMNAMMNETLNVSGALLVKIFGRARDEETRFSQRAAKVRDVGIRQALVGRWFFMGLGLAGALGTALVAWVGGRLVIADTGFTIGTIVAFTAYLGLLYGPISALTNARVDFATSLVSFERVFEVLDLPTEIHESPGATRLDRVSGEVKFEDVSFTYGTSQRAIDGQVAALSEVVRWGQAPAALSLNDGGPKAANGRGKNGAGTVTNQKLALEETVDVDPGQGRANRATPCTI